MPTPRSRMMSTLPLAPPAPMLTLIHRLTRHRVPTHSVSCHQSGTTTTTTATVVVVIIVTYNGIVGSVDRSGRSVRQMDPCVPRQLVRPREPLVAPRMCTCMRFLARMCADMSGLPIVHEKTNMVRSTFDPHLKVPAPQAQN